MTRKIAAAGAAALLAVTLTSCSTSKPTDPAEFAATWIELAVNAASSDSDCETALSWLRPMTPAMTCAELPEYTRLAPETDLDAMECVLTDAEPRPGVRTVECMPPGATLRVSLLGDGDALQVDSVSS